MKQHRNKSEITTKKKLTVVQQSITQNSFQYCFWGGISNEFIPFIVESLCVGTHVHDLLEKKKNPRFLILFFGDMNSNV